jgi:hypothetical protein
MKRFGVLRWNEAKIEGRDKKGETKKRDAEGGRRGAFPPYCPKIIGKKKGAPGL